MKRVNLFMIVATAVMVAFTSCNGDDDGPPILVEDGVYLVGPATPWAELADAARLTITPNERTTDNGGDASAEIFEIYAPLTAGSFNINVVSGGKETLNGGTLTDTYEGSDSPGDLPMEPVYYYNLTAGGNFSVTEAGMYHIVYHKNANKLVITKAIMGIRGGINGWGFTAATPSSDFKTWTLTGVDVTSNGIEWKFAHSGGWKIGLNNLDVGEATVRVNTNFGGSLTIGSDVGATGNLTLAPGGGNYTLDKGIYTMVLTWANGVWSATVTKTAKSDAPDYPEFLYAIGSFAVTETEGGENGWQWDSDYVISMIPVHSHSNAFWTITYFDAGTEFKFAPVKDWIDDFGVSGEATDGVYARGGSNIAVAEAGYYLIYVNLKEDKIFVGEPGVYFIGACGFTGEWNENVPENKFTVGDEGLTHTTFYAGELRMYATCSLADGVDAWQMEFIILDGKIVYRGNGGDQERVQVAAGKTITLDFKAGTGVIE